MFVVPQLPQGILEDGLKMRPSAADVFSKVSGYREHCGSLIVLTHGLTAATMSLTEPFDRSGYPLGRYKGPRRKASPRSSRIASTSRSTCEKLL